MTRKTASNLIGIVAVVLDIAAVAFAIFVISSGESDPIVTQRLVVLTVLGLVMTIGALALRRAAKDQ